MTEFCPGGDLFSLYEDSNIGMDEATAKFYAANIVLILESLHDKGIVHRDIKAENFFIDSSGYLKLGDFGHAKELRGKRAFSMCGTREFMAPEMLEEIGYDFSQDWWSFGCLLYDMLCCDTPFHGMSDRVVTDKILYVQPYIPETLSSAASSLIKMLLDKDLAKRLHEVKDIKRHAFFSGVDWARLKRREVTPRHVPAGVQSTSLKQELHSKVASLKLQKVVSYPVQMSASTFNCFEYIRNPQLSQPRRHSVIDSIRASLQ